MTTYTPIQDANISLLTLIRYIVPKSREKISQSTYERLKASLMASNSTVLKSETGKLYILSEKSVLSSFPSVVNILTESLYQVEVEKIAARMNGGKFAHAYFNKDMTDIPAEHYVECYGQKAFIAIKQNIGRRISYSWNLILK